MHSMTINWPLMVAKFVTLIVTIYTDLSQCVLKILIHIDIFLFQLVGMITRYNLTHEYMEHCLENLG